MNSNDIRRASAPEIEAWIVAKIADLVNVAPDAVSSDADFESFGIDSARAINLIVDLENWLNLPDELPLELLFEADNIAQAAGNIAEAAGNMADAQAQGAGGQ